MGALRSIWCYLALDKGERSRQWAPLHMQGQGHATAITACKCD